MENWNCVDIIYSEIPGTEVTINGVELKFISFDIPIEDIYEKITINPVDFSVDFSGEFRCTSDNTKLLKKLFLKLPRKLKKKLHGTRDSRRRNKINYV